jgi:hypothetical protein
MVGDLIRLESEILIAEKWTWPTRLTGQSSSSRPMVAAMALITSVTAT